MDVSRALLAYDEVLDAARRDGRYPTTADRINAMLAAIAAYEADKATIKAKDSA